MTLDLGEGGETRNVSATVGACFCLLDLDRESLPSSLRTLCSWPILVGFSLSTENSTVDSLNGPPEADKAKKGARASDAETERMVGFVELSSVIALWSQAERIMIFRVMASRCSGISSSATDDSAGRSGGS